MKTDLHESDERLIRVRTARRGTSVELRVHYEVIRLNGCDSYRIILMEEAE